MNNISHKWWDIGELLNIPYSHAAREHIYKVSYRPQGVLPIELFWFSGWTILLQSTPPRGKDWLISLEDIQLGLVATKL